jgi:hypothetical protein
MKRLLKIGLTLAATALLSAAPAHAQKKKLPKSLAVDFDMNHIPEPKERRDSQYYDFFDSSIFEQVQQAFDLPRYFRKKAALNVNAADQVPDSSWFTNRNGQRPMTAEAIRRSANSGSGPDTNGPWTIVGRKPSGISPGFRIKDAAGGTYFIKFDPKEVHEMATGAEVVANQLYYAAGYNTPEIYIARIRPEQLAIGDGARIIDEHGIERLLTREDVARILDQVQRLPDGTLRVVAKKLLTGVPKGPFQFVGVRRDDPNDWIPHEHRRDLRGLRVIAAWLNDNDLRERNTLDMYVTEGGRSFLRHYLIDAGSALGSETLFANTNRVGFEYILDWGEVGKATGALGAYEPWWHGRTPVSYPSIGYIESGRFQPQRWKANFPIVAFENMSTADGYWGAKIVMSFTDEQIRAAVSAGEYSDPRAAEYLAQVLMDRRDRIGRYWYRRAGALDNFRGTAGPDGPALLFDDLAVVRGFAEPAERHYRYRILDGKREWRNVGQISKSVLCPSSDAVTSTPGEMFCPASLSQTLALSGQPPAELQIELQVRNSGESRWSPAVTVFLRPGDSGLHVAGWLRAAE